MLAGETAAGAHAVRAVKTLNAVIGDAETAPIHSPSAVTTSGHNDHARALQRTAVTQGERALHGQGAGGGRNSPEGKARLTPSA